MGLERGQSLGLASSVVEAPAGADAMEFQNLHAVLKALRGRQLFPLGGLLRGLLSMEGCECA